MADRVQENQRGTSDGAVEMLPARDYRMLVVDDMDREFEQLFTGLQIAIENGWMKGSKRYGRRLYHWAIKWHQWPTQ